MRWGRRGAWPGLLALIALICLLAAGSEGPLPGQEKGTTKRAPPPLKVDKDAPRLLDEPDKKKPDKTKVTHLADNSACHVCHANFEEESLALDHAKGNVGCVKCHGESSAHCNDEANLTPPDTMYPLAVIDAACRKCHTTHNAPATKVLASWRERCSAKTNPKDIVCTDCHGHHRLQRRTVRWDKRTGKLLTQGQGK